MKYTTKEVRDENGALSVVFSFANGKEITLSAREFPSGKAMITEATKRAS
jgi:hypothetical protein